MVIFRKTYGWDKKEDRISNSQFSKITGISRNHIPRIINKLISRNIIYRVSPDWGTVPRLGDRLIITYGFQKDFDKWDRCPPFRGLSPEQDRSVPQSGYGSFSQNTDKAMFYKQNFIKKGGSPNQGHTKDNYIKETIQKKKTLSNPQIKEFMDFYFKEFKNYFGLPPLIKGGKDGMTIKRLLKIIQFDDLKDLLLIFFSSSDKFIKQSGYTLGAFESQINKLRINNKQSGLRAWAQEIIIEEANHGREG